MLGDEVAHADSLSEGPLRLGRLTLNFHPDRLLGDGRSVLNAQDFGSDFKGPEAPPLARFVQERFTVEHGRLDAATIGHAAESVVTSPDDWRQFGSPAETLQLIKYIWHTLVRFGAPYSAAQNAS